MSTEIPGMQTKSICLDKENRVLHQKSAQTARLEEVLQAKSKWQRENGTSGMKKALSRKCKDLGKYTVSSQVL